MKGQTMADARPPTALHVSRRTVIAGAAGLLAGGGVLAPASAHAAGRGRPSSLSVEQQAGQRVIWSYAGPTPPAALYAAIRSGLVGGVIFFGENLKGLTRQQIQQVTRSIDDAQAGSGVGYPLLLMTDQEGGRVQRLPGAPGISQKQIGLSADPVGTARSAGLGAAQNLLDAGMSCNLAPVLDVYRQDGDFEDQYSRSYSKDPVVCGQLGAASIGAQQSLGVVTTAKHFPGLGAAAADQNTDIGPLTLPLSLGELRTVDELPYRAAIEAGVDLVMTSWATYPALDRRLPAGLSSRTIKGELRGRLRFRGVTITDALEAKALTAFGDTGQRAVLAAKAGMDLVLCSAKDLTQSQAAVSALATAIGTGGLGPGESDRALERVLGLRGRLG
ncbi:MAG: glycoside hydrolase family 3 N-terminal domain-containing protein [Lapillicoccus sp.]